MSTAKSLDLSLVIPVYNEADSLSDLYREMTDSCTKLDRSYEIIFVEDGSWDASFSVLKKIQKKEARQQIKN